MPTVFMDGGAMAAPGGGIAFAHANFMAVWGAREAKDVKPVGEARWVEREEGEKAGLLGADGVVLGRYGSDYLRHDGAEHTLCFAPTRSGKGGLSCRRY